MENVVSHNKSITFLSMPSFFFQYYMDLIRIQRLQFLLTKQKIAFRSIQTKQWLVSISMFCEILSEDPSTLMLS